MPSTAARIDLDQLLKRAVRDKKRIDLYLRDPQQHLLGDEIKFVKPVAPGALSCEA